MLERIPAGHSTESLYSQVETATDAWFASFETSVRRSARGLLVALIVFSISAAIVTCIVVSSVGVGIIGGSGVTGGAGVSSEQATETYGAEQFHIQLTAQAGETRSP